MWITRAAQGDETWVRILAPWLSSSVTLGERNLISFHLNFLIWVDKADLLDKLR